MRIWRHKKRGTAYTEVRRCQIQIATTLKDNDYVVIYEGEDGEWHVRGVAEFEDGRFEEVK